MMLKQYPNKNQNGFSLVEVMVSLFVLATGILGMAGLQAVSLQNSAKSVARTQAAYMSHEILDRIRVNKTQNYVAETGSVPDYTECFTQACTPAQLMAFDLAEWKCSFSTFKTDTKCTDFFANNNSILSADTILLNGDGSISCATTSGVKRCSVTITWQENDTSEAGFKQFNYTISVIL